MEKKPPRARGHDGPPPCPLCSRARPHPCSQRAAQDLLQKLNGCSCPPILDVQHVPWPTDKKRPAPGGGRPSAGLRRWLTWQTGIRHWLGESASCGPCGAALLLHWHPRKVALSAIWVLSHGPGHVYRVGMALSSASTATRTSSPTCPLQKYPGCRRRLALMPLLVCTAPQQAPAATPCPFLGQPQISLSPQQKCCRITGPEAMAYQRVAAARRHDAH